MQRFPCPYLGDDVELTDERQQHIAETHPDLLPDYQAQIADTIASPDQINQSKRFTNSLLFVRWYNFIYGGKYVVVVIVVDAIIEK